MRIEAPREDVWKLLTDADALPNWNSTVVSLDGKIALGETVKVVVTDAPDDTFELVVTKFDPPAAMVWEDGNAMFQGVRHYALIDNGDGTTTFAMSETFSGGMLGMIEGSLPDFRESFRKYAADLKAVAEGSVAAR